MVVDHGRTGGKKAGEPGELRCATKQGNSRAA